MNKAAFLNIINHVAAISEQEVADLEKLATSFPYCQTAHLLLAKAAYDHGSMLSNQRLRRAAACATNRQLLKKLIYTAAPDLVVAPIENPPAIAHELITGDNREVEALVRTEMPAIESPVIEALAADPMQNIPLPAEETTTPEAEAFLPAAEESEVVETSPAAESETVNEKEQILPYLAAPKQPEASPLFLMEAAEIIDDQDNLFFIENLNPAASYRDPVVNFISNLVDAETQTLPEKVSVDVTVKENLNAADQPATTEETGTAESITAEPALLDESEVAIETEFDLEADDKTLAQFDAYLFKPEKEVEPEAKPPYKEEIIYKIFSQNDLGYWMASSRLGENIQLKDELTPAQPYYFQPELILEYSRQHKLENYSPPTATPHNPQFDIIDQFLRQNPKLKSMAHTKVKAEPLEDLSLKSTKVKKNLSSETLANILIKQGKTKKAIKIYEHLILKIPEKKAYFVAQIQNLQKLT